ncbi:MAG: hypothetical protein HY720_24355 [Planctomycetes bacterium]|nr:hypothetical protein [Planctomycetota bacterium]
MAEALRVVCPRCGTRYLIQPTALGKRVTCQKCKAQFTPAAPGAAGAPAGPDTGAPAEPGRSPAAVTFTVLGRIVFLAGLGFLAYVQVPAAHEATRLEVLRGERKEKESAHEEEMKRFDEAETDGSREEKRRAKEELIQEHEKATRDLDREIEDRKTGIELSSRERFERSSMGIGGLLLGLLLVALAGSRAERFAAVAAIFLLVL